MLNVALVGCGGIANWHAGELKKLSDLLTVVAVCDTEPARSAEFKQKYFPEAKEYTDYDALLGHPPAKLDAVVLVTPHTLHYPQAKAALLAGVHVLVEKPMVTSSAHAYDLWRLQKASGRQLGITFQAPYTAEFQYLKSLRESGRWGRVQVVQGWVAQAWKAMTTGTWRQNPALAGGGQMYDSGAHVFNSIMWLLDEPVVEVSCMYDRCGTALDVNAVAVMRFASGALGSVTIGGNTAGWSTRIGVQTDRVHVFTTAHGTTLELIGNPGLKYPHVPVDAAPAAFTPHRNFALAIMGAERLQVGPRYGVLLSTLIDALFESAERKSIVQVPPVPAEI